MFSWSTCLLKECQKHRMAGVGRHLWRSSSLAPQLKAGFKRAGCSFSCPVGFWISSAFMKKRNTFFKDIYITGMQSELTTTKLFPLTLLTQWNCLLSSMLTLCWAVPSLNLVFNERSTLKMLLINISGTEQIFVYQLQLLAVLCLDFGIHLELMSWKILEHPNQN